MGALLDIARLAAPPEENGTLGLTEPDPAMEKRRRQVLAILAEDPRLRVAVLSDSESDPVRLAVAIRDKGTVELHIPAARFDSFQLLELIKRHGGMLH